MRAFSNYFFSISFAFFFFSSLAGHSNEKGNFQNALVWQISKAGSKDTSYLVGTLHLPLKSVFSAIDTCEELIKHCDTAFFELVMSREMLAQQALYFLAQNSEDRVQNILDSNAYLKLMKLAKATLGPSASVINQLKPIGIYSVITLSNIPSDTSNAVDVLYQELAAENGVAVAGIETLEEQIAVLDTLQKYGGKKILLELIEKFDSLMIQQNELVEAYLRKDLNKILAITNEELNESIDFVIKEELLYKRNRNMAIRIGASCAKSSGFFAIGAAHLVGQEGVLHLLELQGYQLVPLQ